MEERARAKVKSQTKNYQVWYMGLKETDLGREMTGKKKKINEEEAEENQGRERSWRNARLPYSRGWGLPGLYRYYTLKMDGRVGRRAYNRAGNRWERLLKEQWCVCSSTQVCLGGKEQWVSRRRSEKLGEDSYFSSHFTHHPFSLWKDDKLGQWNYFILPSSTRCYLTSGAQHMKYMTKHAIQ